MDESTVLNPAPIAFYNTGALYLQKVETEYTPSEGEKDFSSGDDVKSVMISDAKGGVKGSLGYTHQVEGNAKRKRISAAVGHRVSDRSALGFAYWHTKDYNDIESNPDQEDKYNQMVLGVTHALNEEFTLGAIVIDPLKEKAEDNRFIVGFQYLYQKYLAIMLDGGSNYNEDLSTALLYRAAVQFKFYQDFYARMGMFDDKQLMEKGNGIGLGWVGPRLSLEGAYKNTKPKGESESLISYNQKVRELSLSLSYIF
jgi:hypothetical protein